MLPSDEEYDIKTELPVQIFLKCVADSCIVRYIHKKDDVVEENNYRFDDTDFRKLMSFTCDYRRYKLFEVI